jgi:hypothetical protein
MASLGELLVPVDGTEYLDLDAIVRALDDWAVKQKFCFRTAKREASVAIFVCAEAEELGCAWRCRTWQIVEEIWILSIITGEHTCIGRGLRKYTSASKKEWLDPVFSCYLNVTKKATLVEIKDLLRVRLAKEISYKVA